MHRIGVCGAIFMPTRDCTRCTIFPRVLGHEMSGEVVEVHKNEKTIRVGDVCAIEPF